MNIDYEFRAWDQKWGMSGAFSLGEFPEWERNIEDRVYASQTRDVKSPGFQTIQIGFRKGCFCERVLEQKNIYYGKLPSPWAHIFNNDLSIYKIIGNIYDNPELASAKEISCSE